ADALWLQGKRFGTVGARKDGQLFEITTHRDEAYRPESRKPDVRFADAVEADLARRDFTINAMALTLPGLELIDPFDGLTDLAAQRLRTPLTPEESFEDDPLRMLRAAPGPAARHRQTQDPLVRSQRCDVPSPRGGRRAHGARADAGAALLERRRCRRHASGRAAPAVPWVPRGRRWLDRQRGATLRTRRGPVARSVERAHAG